MALVALSIVFIALGLAFTLIALLVPADRLVDFILRTGKVSPTHPDYEKNRQILLNGFGRKGSLYSGAVVCFVLAFIWLKRSV
jgi:hypothetical protein